jgi:FkbH-like protein
MTIDISESLRQERSLRAEIDALIANGDAPAARRLLADLWREEASPATASFVTSRFEMMRGALRLQTCKVAVLRSFTVEPIIAPLRASAFLGGLDLTVQIGDFNAYAQEILDEGSPLYGFEPDVVLLAVQAEDVTPELWDGFADLDSDDVITEINRVASLYEQLVRAFRSRSSAHLVIHSLLEPPAPSLGILDTQLQHGQLAAIRKVNDAISAVTYETADVYVLDYSSLVKRRGSVAWHDQRNWLTSRLPIAASELIAFAEEWIRFLHPLTGKICKALAVDLDNTLWGGVLGEDGIEGIQLNDEYPGAGYRSLQRVMLDLIRRGVVLAICSKNNHDEAVDALQNHPGMLLHLHDFASLRINWKDKATNLREIAQELNVGIDSLAFLDDNSIECAWVQAQLPEVTVIELSSDPMKHAATLRAAPVFERLSLTEEDRVRSRLYADQRQRNELAESTTSLEDFYRSLGMVVEIEAVNSKTLARASQLTQKTNQFNLTTRRYTEQQLTELVSSDDSNIYTVRVRDRFGDNGIVGVAIIRYGQEACEIDSFLLSCRVIGRTIETAVLATIAEQARAANIQKLVGHYVPTSKNAPAQDFYHSHGFTQISSREDGSRWELQLGGHQLSSPPWIDRQIAL